MTSRCIMKLVPTSDENVLSGESDPDETSQLHGYTKSMLRIDCFLVEMYIIKKLRVKKPGLLEVT